MRVRRARTSWVTSLTILAFSRGERVLNHLASRWESEWGGRCQQCRVSQLVGEEGGQDSRLCPGGRGG